MHGPGTKTTSQEAGASEEHVAVNRCVCFDASFDRIKAIADAGGGLLAAHQQTGCGARCGLCIPYIQVMLKTGETDLPIMWSDDFAQHAVNPGPVARIERQIRSQGATA